MINYYLFMFINYIYLISLIDKKLYIFKVYDVCFDIHCEMITTNKLNNKSITSHSYHVCAHV